LPVSVKLLLKSLTTGRELVVKGYVNTGFMADSPDIAIPVPVAERLGLWPVSTRESIIVSIETGGGVVEAHLIPQALVVKVITSDRESREVVANALINPYTDSVLISDYLTEELGIQLLYPRRGLWKFADEDKVRESE